MSYQDIRNAREGFVRSDIGDKLVRIEAFIVGVLCFSGLIALGKSFGVAVFTGIVVSAILPWLMGLIPAFAWIAAIVFSLVWATLGYFIGEAIFGDSPLVGGLIAVTYSYIVFLCTKYFLDLGISVLVSI